MFYLLSRLLRPFIHIKQMCDGCLGWQEYQTKDGKLLCKKCYESETNDC